MTAVARRARTAFVWVGAILPLTILAVSTVIVALWLPELPEPSAIHWGANGADGFGPGWIHVVILLGIAVLVGVLALIGANTPRRRSETNGDSPWSSTSRLLGATNLGLASVVSFVSLVSVGTQRGLADAVDAPDIGPASLAGIGLLAGGALAGWFLQPDVPRPERRDSAGAAPLATSATERVVWIGTASIAPLGLAVLGGSALAVCALAAVLAATGVGGPGVVIVLLAAALVVLALVVTTAFRVRIGPAGLLVRSRAGWPRIEIPVADIVAARAIEVDPFAEFGGWGVRHGLDGRSGVVLRRGEALEVTRTGGRRFVVTVDDAATAAGVLATAVARRR